MADEDKKGKTVSGSTPEKSGGSKKAAVKKKSTAKKKAVRKKVSKKKGVAKKKTAAAPAATPESKTMSEKSGQRTNVSEKPKDKVNMRDESASKEKPTTAAATPATGNPSRWKELLFVALLAIFLAAAIAVLGNQKLEESIIKQVHKTMRILGVGGFSARPQSDTASQPQERTESASPAAAPQALQLDPVPGGGEKAEIKQAAAEPALPFVPQAPAIANPEPLPLPAYATAAEPATAPVSESTADVPPVPETEVSRPAIAVPSTVDVPVEDTASVSPPAQIAQPAAPKVQAIEEPVPAVAEEAAIEQRAARPPVTRHGYNPYSRYPYGYPGGYGRDYYDQGYPVRPPQPQYWPR